VTWSEQIKAARCGALAGYQRDAEANLLPELTQSATPWPVTRIGWQESGGQRAPADILDKLKQRSKQRLADTNTSSRLTIWARRLCRLVRRFRQVIGRLYEKWAKSSRSRIKAE